MAMAKEQPTSNQMLQVCHQASNPGPTSKAPGHQSCNLEATSKAQDRQTSSHQLATSKLATTKLATNIHQAVTLQPPYNQQSNQHQSNKEMDGGSH